MIASAIILAAGRGERMGSPVRKAFLDLRGRPLFAYALGAFAHVPRVREIVVVAHPDDIARARSAIEPIAPQAVVVAGGATRRESSLAGIRAASGDAVLIHDGCRPFVSPDLIDRVLDSVGRCGAVVPVLPAVETLYRVKRGDRRVAEVLDRGAIVGAQTPQGFERRLILECLEAADSTVTDDASALLALGRTVFVLDGETTNRKITVPEDLRWAEWYAEEP